MTEPIEDMTFEKALKELEALVVKLEEGSLALDETLTLFERGQKLSEHCNTLLDKATLRVEQLTVDGEIIELTS